MVDDVQEFTLLRRSSLASGVGHLLVKTKPQAAECEGTENRVAEGVVATDLVGHHRSFDGLRIILVSMVTTCLGWTVWLLLLNIAPNNMVNRIMDTSNLESGSFWQFVDLPLPIYGLAIFGLTIIGLGYSFVLIKLIWKRAHSRVLPETGALARGHGQNLKQITFLCGKLGQFTSLQRKYCS
ncbi:hypothetical protein L915_11188 [Phytophthora nicotianae]|uniref:Uncharacterized protein n=1 Tax=Phytophthora nicotianae TaxID=4792 RepID=W2GL76_PHYNI|nr:hypothetical protein L915_11188 [Phytophthora nicotianae]